MLKLGKINICQTGLAWIWVSVLVLALDRFSKWWMMHHLELYSPLQIWPMLNFTLAYNKGAAFSFLESASGWQNVALGSIACIVSFVMLCALVKSPVKRWWTNIAFCLIIAGALGNVWDRAMYHFVIDFISFHIGTWYFAIFNIADSAITIGAIMLILSWLKRPVAA